MSPTLEGGDYILTLKPRRIAPGFVYVINHSDLGQIVKRCAGSENGYYNFTGDNPQSTPDSLLTTVEKYRIVDRAWLRIGPKGLKLI